MDVVAVAESTLQLPNYFTNGQPLRPTVPISNANIRNVRVWVLMRRCFVDTGNSLSSHICSSKESVRRRCRGEGVLLPAHGGWLPACSLECGGLRQNPS